MRVVGSALVLDAAEAVAALAAVPLAVVVELHLPHGVQAACLAELSTDSSLYWLTLVYKLLIILVNTGLQTPDYTG